MIILTGRSLLMTALFLCAIISAPAQFRSPDFADVEYARVDDSISLLLDIYLPPDRSHPAPVIVWIHGGGWQSGDKSLGQRAFYVDREYAVVSINYRLSDVAIMPAQIHDCKGAIRWIRAHAEEYGFDPDRIGSFGSSAGGHLSALLATSNGVEELEGSVGGNLEYSSDVNASVDWYGPSNLQTIADYPSGLNHAAANSPESKLIGGMLAQYPDRAWSASPIAYVAGDEPPILIQHGTLDNTVPYHQSVELDSALRSVGADVTFSPVVGGGHGNGFQVDSVRQPVLDFFARVFLKGGGSSAVELPGRIRSSSSSLYPNPSAGQVRIRTSGESPAAVTFMTMDGRSIWNGTVVKGEMIDCSSFPPGSYLCRIQTGEEVGFEKMIIRPR